MAQCLVSQAQVLAAMVPGVRLQPPGEEQVAPGGSKRRRGRFRRRRRGQSSAAAVDDRACRGGADGKVRVADVRTKDGRYRQAIHRLAFPPVVC